VVITTIVFDCCHVMLCRLFVPKLPSFCSKVAVVLPLGWFDVCVIYICIYIQVYTYIYIHVCYVFISIFQQLFVYMYPIVYIHRPLAGLQSLQY